MDFLFFLRRIGGGIYHRISYLINKSSFLEIHYTDVIVSPILLTPKAIYLEENVFVFKNARIQGVFKYNEKIFNPVIKICRGVSIQQNLHLTCANSVIIGANTAIAANVTITDIHHPYDDIEIPIESQDIRVSHVIIGEGCKVYNNVVILPGTELGKHVTVGANSVVHGVFPDYSVIAGAPAKIVKVYDFSENCWKRTNHKGSMEANT